MLISSCKTVGIDENIKEGVSGSAVDSMTDDINNKLAEDTKEKEDGIISNIVGRIVMHSDCKEVSISLLEIEGRKELCMYKNTLTIGLLNDGNKPLRGIDLLIEGEKSGEISTKIRSGIGIGSASRQIVRYNTETYGEIEKVTIIPVIMTDDGEAACDEGSIKEKGIMECR